MRNRVREQRTQRGLSQAELAAALGVSRQTVISIESGRYLPSLPLAFTIARFFDLTVDKMFDPDEEAEHMTTFIRPRLRKPAGIALAGLLFAAAWLVRGGPLWWVSILAAITTAVRVLSWYRMSAKDTDEGALAAHVQTSASTGQPALTGSGLQSRCGRFVPWPDRGDRGQRRLVLAVPGHPRRYRLWLPARPVQLRIRRAGCRR